MRLLEKFVIFVFAIFISSTISSAQSPVPANGTLIVLNKSDASASIISLKNNQTIVTIPTGDGPHEAAVTPDGKTAVVTNYGNREAPGSTLTVIDLSQLKVSRTIDLGDYHKPHGLIFLPGGNELLVTAEAEKALLVIDLESGTVEKAILTGQEVSHMVAFAPAVNLAFVANIRSGSVNVIDVKKSASIKIIETGAGAEGIDVSPDGSEVWVSNRADDSVSIINIGSLKIVHTLESKSYPIRVKFTPDGKFALVSNARSGDVAVFDTKARQEVRRIPMKLKAKEGTEIRLFSNRFGDSPVPVGIFIHPDGGFAYIANTNADIVTVIDLSSWEIVNRLKTGREPDGLGFTPLNLQQITSKN